MGAIDHPTSQPVPPAAVSRILSRFSREELEGFVAVAIDLMDVADGDPDRENATDLEDDFTLSPVAVAYTDHGPGCSVSDQDAGAWVEWHTMRGSQKRGPNILAGREDDEDSDPAEDDDSDRDASGDDWIAGGNLNCGGMLFAGADKFGDDDDEESQQPANTGPTC